MLQIRRNDPARRRRVKRDLANIPKKGIAGIRIKGQAQNSEIDRSNIPRDPVDGANNSDDDVPQPTTSDGASRLSPPPDTLPSTSSNVKDLTDDFSRLGIRSDSQPAVGSESTEATPPNPTYSNLQSEVFQQYQWSNTELSSSEED